MVLQKFSFASSTIPSIVNSITAVERLMALIMFSFKREELMVRVRLLANKSMEKTLPLGSRMGCIITLNQRCSAVPLSISTAPDQCNCSVIARCNCLKCSVFRAFGGTKSTNGIPLSVCSGNPVSRVNNSFASVNSPFGFIDTCSISLLTLSKICLKVDSSPDTFCSLSASALLFENI